ncbi:MAG: site-specific DNA-methyltransferase [Candidatus Portnoybacteria bacterium]|nr:site-specific DNA-methyltransferase [Candidatus Portnoybacteria bacterium]
MYQTRFYKQRELSLRDRYAPNAEVVLYTGDCLNLLDEIPNESIQLIVTSPPYNLGKEYEEKISLWEYISQQRKVIIECARKLKREGSICWQVGNYVGKNDLAPLDIILYPIFEELGLKLRNRIIWHFEHGLHCSKRLSGRHETILWFTKSDDYVFNLDPIRVPQKYPNKKYYKGEKKGQYSSNPLGKNPGDVWIIPNVKHNHPEKTIHPCQFPVELIERLVLSLTNEGDWVLDPFIGVGSAAVAAVLHYRRAIGADVVPKYIEIAKKRVKAVSAGLIKIRPMARPIYEAPVNMSYVRKLF